MRILYLANNKIGWEIVRWLLKQENVEIVGLVLHPESKRKYGSEITETVNLPSQFIFDGSTLQAETTFQAISVLNVDIAISVLFGYILKSRFIELFPAGVINLHPSYLPYNRGQYPNVWSIVEGTPAGVTLHYIDPGIDTGDIIAQKKVEIEPVDTGKTLYEKLELASVNLFKETWPLIQNDRVTRIPQLNDEGTFHRTRDVDQIDHIDLDKTYTARHLLNILRARTFPPYKGAYFTADDGRRVNIRIELDYEEDGKDDGL